MAEKDLGKKWEDYFRQNWARCFPGTFLFRLKDQMTGYKETSGNPCDFITFPGNRLFMVECKEHKGASIPFVAIPQYERLLLFKNQPKVSPGILIWFSEKDKILWVPILEAEKMVLDGRKSIGIKMLEEKLYNIFEVPSVKKRVFLEANYRDLTDWEDVNGQK